MRVLFLERQPCMRALKYAVGLRAAAIDVELGFAYQGRTLGEWYGTGDELFDRWYRLGPSLRSELARALDDFAPDIVHSHNLPDELTVLALDVTRGLLPVVHDVHDMQSLRRTPYEDGFGEPADPLALERRAVEGAAALVTVSDELLSRIAERYRLPAHTLVFANYAVGADLPTDLPPPDRRDDPLRVVYQGSVSTNGGHYDLREIFTRIGRSGVRLDVYPSRPAPAYRELARTLAAMTCHETLTPRRLLAELPSYDFGWVGFNAALNGAHLDTVLPNKAFDYLGCGLPLLTLGHAALVRMIAEHGVGLPHADPAGLATQLAAVDLVALRRRVARARHQFTVEANVPRLVELYRGLTGVG